MMELEWYGERGLENWEFGDIKESGAGDSEERGQEETEASKGKDEKEK